VMRFVATADWQLGMTAHFLPPEARARFQQARFDAVRAVGRVAAEREAAFVLVCGDVFESNHLDRRVLSRAFEALRDVPVPVWLLPGNHDPLDAASIFDSDRFRELCPDHVHVLRMPGIHQVAPGVEVVAAPWFTKRPLSDLVADACSSLQPCDAVVRILAGHGATDALNPDCDDVATLSTSALTQAIDGGCVQVAMLGDRHSTTEVAPAVWHPGAPEVTHRREDDPGNVLVVDVEPEGVLQVEPVRIGRWRFLDERRDLAAAADVDLLQRWFSDQPDKDRTAVWLSLQGTLSLHDSARLESVLADARDVFARVELWTRHTDLHVLPDEGDLTRLDLSGFAAETLAALRETLADAAAPTAACADRPRPDEASVPARVPPPEHDLADAGVAQAALGLLYRLAGGAR